MLFERIANKFTNVSINNMRVMLIISLLSLIPSSVQQYLLFKQHPTRGQCITIYVIDHGWHTGIVIPAKQIRAELSQLSQRFPKTDLIEFGWGDKSFYQSKEIKISLAIRALLLPTDTVVHAVEVPRDPAQYFVNAKVTKLEISPDDFTNLRQFIISSFAITTQGEVMPDSPGIYGNSQFYKGRGVYHLMRTCNKWTAEALQSAGLDINPMFRLTADSITYASAVEAARQNIDLND